MSKDYFLSPTAIRHLREHKKWSLRQFGLETTKKYFQDIDKGLRSIAENYKCFPRREELAGGAQLSIYPVREHYVAFVVLDDSVYIVDILGQTQDTPNILSENAAIFERELAQFRNGYTHH